MFSDLTEFKSLKCEIEWKLTDFYKHEQYMQNGQFLTSKQFYNQKCPSVKWELRIYYNNLYKKGTWHTHYSISLVQVGLKDSDYSLNAKFNFYLLDDKESTWKSLLGSARVNNFKYKIESDKCAFNKPTNGIDLTIFCEVEFVPYNLKLENKFDEFSTPKTSFMDIFNKGIFTDCVFEIGDEKINAHKCILANYSIVFQTMFEQICMEEAKTGKIKIVDSSPECFKAMLEYFYSGEIDKKTIEKHSENLFAIAHKYQVKQLMQVCEYYMAEHIDVANFNERCNYAELYCLSNLEKACINYFSANKETFILSEEWDKLKNNNKDLAIRLLEEKQILEEKIVKNVSKTEN